MTDRAINRVRVSNSNFTVSEYVDQMEAGTIIINKEYQRSDKVWPLSAKSYLIDTILLGYPIPKLSLYQRTDLKTRKTIKEVVDGQQRSSAIRQFREGKFAIIGSSEFSGKYFDDLDEDLQVAFLSYSISVDLLLQATPSEIREMFRRINSYTVPLNPQEKRHAINQGDFKFYMVSLSETYSESLKQMGVLKEKQLSRMADVELLADIIMSWIKGIETIRSSTLDKFYSDKDKSFPEKSEISDLFQTTMSVIISMRNLHSTSLMKPYNFHSLFLAISHKLKRSNKLENLVHSNKKTIDISRSEEALSVLAEAIESKDRSNFPDLVDATSSSTNLQKNREERFKHFFRALSEAS